MMESFPGLPAPPLASFTPGGTAPPGLQIRPPREGDARAWRMLLPQVASSNERSRILVATLPFQTGDKNTARRVIAAAAATEQHVQAPLRGPRVLAHVIPPLRRQGIGRALLAALSEFVFALSPLDEPRPQALHAWSLVAHSAPEAQLWRALGFSAETRVRSYDLDAAEAEARLRPLFERARSRIPADVSIIFLEQASDAQKQQIVGMHVKYLGGRATEMRAMIDGPQPRYRGRSLVLLRGDRVIGFSLTRMVERDVTNIDANVIEPEHRKGWANIYLKYEEARSQLAEGIRATRFQTLEHLRDTQRFAERTESHDSGVLLSLYRPLDHSSDSL